MGNAAWPWQSRRPQPESNNPKRPPKGPASVSPKPCPVHACTCHKGDKHEG